MDIRQTLHHLGEIIPARPVDLPLVWQAGARGGQAGEIRTDDPLENIFSKFCLPLRNEMEAGIGK